MAARAEFDWLTNQQRGWIRRSNWPQQKIADRYGISKAMVRRVRATKG